MNIVDLYSVEYGDDKFVVIIVVSDVIAGGGK